jgi:hypothetical protein
MSEGAHTRPPGYTPEPLFDVRIPTPTHAERANIGRPDRHGDAGCTWLLSRRALRMASFVTVTLENADPIFLISGLAEHTRNL